MGAANEQHPIRQALYSHPLEIGCIHLFIGWYPLRSYSKTGFYFADSNLLRCRTVTGSPRSAQLVFIQSGVALWNYYTPMQRWFNTMSHFLI